jgi:hypothetical protein
LYIINPIPAPRNNTPPITDPAYTPTLETELLEEVKV